MRFKPTRYVLSELQRATSPSPIGQIEKTVNLIGGLRVVIIMVSIFFFFFFEVSCYYTKWLYIRLTAACALRAKRI